MNTKTAKAFYAGEMSRDENAPMAFSIQIEWCEFCGAKLSIYNEYAICAPCQEKLVERISPKIEKCLSERSLGPMVPIRNRVLAEYRRWRKPEE